MNNGVVKRVTDWEAIERAYRAGILSIREVAKLHGITDKAVRNKAKAADWQRDLSAKVAEKVRTELVRSQSAPADKIQTEREIVDVAAATVVQVVRSHRIRIAKATSVVDMLTQQLIEAASSRDDLEDEIEEMTKGDRTSERRTRLMRAVALITHSSVAVNLTSAQKSLIGMERQAFNIKEDSEPERDDLSALLAQINGTSLPITK